MKLVLGMNIKDCPLCKNGTLSETDETVRCSNCGPVSNTTLISAVYGVSKLMASKLLATGKTKTLAQTSKKQFAQFAYSNAAPGTIINALDENGDQLIDVPTIYPMLEDGYDVILTDEFVPDTPYPSPVMIYKGGINPEWCSWFQGKTVTIIYHSNEPLARTLAKMLTDMDAAVRLGKYAVDGPTSYNSAVACLGVKDRVIELEDRKSLKGVSLRELVESYHSIILKGRVIYKPSLQIPVAKAVDGVIQWFRDNGARFLWDTSEDQGYMLYNNRVYILRESNPLLRSLLKELGGISRATSDGKAIFEGMTALANTSEEVRPMQWLNVDTVKGEIAIRQGETTIKVSKEGVRVEEIDSLSYDLILGDKKWFTPITFKEGSKHDGLDMLFRGVADYFACPPVARELLISWLIAIFLKDYSSIRPGVRVSGPASTGKSTMLQLLYWLFYGKDDMELPAFPTVAGLWRISSMEPFIPLDNKNLEDMGDDVRTFLDVAATGGKRVLGVSGGDTREVRFQKAHTFVLISGLDVSLHHDVRTRYFEIETDPTYKTGFYSLKQRQFLFENRDTIMSAILELLSQDVLPTIQEYANEQMAAKYRVLLDTKERTVDYFLLMLAVGSALQKYGLIPEGDLGIRWTDYIREKADATDRNTALTVEWWRNFKIAVTKSRDQIFDFTSDTPYPFNFIYKDKKIIGITGSPEDLLNALAWAAKELGRQLPWKTVRAYTTEMKQDKKTWDLMGWEQVISGETIILKWGEGI